MPVMPGEFVISQDCVATVAEELELRLPATVAREPLYFARDERAAMREAAYRELTEMGLSDERGPSTALTESLRVLASGKLHAAARTGVDARRVASTDPVVFLDTEDGRWVAYATDNGAGARHVTANPGRMDTIANKLTEVRQGLLAGRH